MRAIGSTGTDANIERLVLLHTINSYFQSRMNIPWAQWYFFLKKRRLQRYSLILFFTYRFVCTLRGSGYSKFLANAQKGAVKELPFIVQRLGRYAVWSGAHGRIGSIAESSELYDVRDIAEAIALWAMFMLDGYDGIVPGNVHCAPLLRAIIRLPSNCNNMEDNAGDGDVLSSFAFSNIVSGAGAGAGASESTVTNAFDNNDDNNNNIALPIFITSDM